MLLGGRKAMMNLGIIIKKQRHHFADKDAGCQSDGFSVVIYRFEIWTIKKAED